jgi:23S rRNA (cytosine1962-C5)-methyltransferase
MTLFFVSELTEPNSMTARLFLAKGREKSLLRRHPWVFSGAVTRVEGKALSGDTIDIVDSQGKWLARGAYSPASQIRVRVWTFRQDEDIDIEFFVRRLQQAQSWRDWIAKRDGLDSYRLIAGESDGLPGITIDRFQNFLVLQLLSAGAEYQRAPLLAALQKCYPECAIWDRSDVAVRKKEGLELTQGHVLGEEPPALLPIQEHGMSLLVDIKEGHKTGFYLDQRDSRLAARKYAAGRKVLNCFSYTGAFAVSALMGGCEKVINVDTSQSALDIARQNVELNNLDLSKAEFVREDVFQLLRKYRAEGEQFDMIVMDPPKFVENKNQLASACRGYKDINMLALQLLRPGGILLSFSCSGLLPTDLFQKILADAALDAHREIQFVEQFRQAADHPVIGSYPEGLYLKGFACVVMS